MDDDERFSGSWRDRFPGTEIETRGVQIQVGKSAYSATLAVFSDFTFTVLAGIPTFT
jgi:hypothetical protein